MGMTDRVPVKPPSRVASLALNAGVVLGFAVFIFGLYLAWRPLAALVGGPLFAAGCFFVEYDRIRRSRS